MSIYDNTSITETIYNVYDMVPFDYNTSSLYGHYGLFFLLPLRILGRATPEKVVGLLACAGGITYCRFVMPGSSNQNVIWLFSDFSNSDNVAIDYWRICRLYGKT